MANAQADDCPLAHEPYSTQTPLGDLLLDDRSRAVLDREVPDLVATLTRDHGGGPLPPGFANILTPQLLLNMRPDGEALKPRLDAELARIPITPEATAARCARYDETPPALPERIGRPAILVFDKITGFRDEASVQAATAALKAMGERRGWTLVFSDNGAVFTDPDLARFDAVVWNNVSGDALTLPQRKAFRSWIEAGGGYAGIHGSAGDPVYIWDWYADTLLGARFIGHPADPQFQAARIIVEEPGSGVTQGLPAEWTMSEEWYSFASSPRDRGAHVLARLDESSYAPVGFGNQDIAMGDHPIAWARCIGQGRSFYTAIGHRPESYSEPNSLALLEQGIAWAAGLGDRPCGDNAGRRRLTVDASRPTGPLKPLRGVNGAPDVTGHDPAIFGANGRWPRVQDDISAGYRAARVNLIRTHDSYGAADIDPTSGPLPSQNPDAGPGDDRGRLFDPNVIFPDLSADPSDPASYNWGPTDRLIDSYRVVGAEPMFRLGREGMTTAPPPADLGKYGEIIRHIVLHYNKGWDGGYFDAVKYWEVWNEPDLGAIWWRGTPQQYYALYGAAARAVKAADPGALVGGPAIAVVNEPGPYREGFLDFVRANGLPLDFFAWHWYSTDADDPYDFVRIGEVMQQLLDERGFTDTLNVVDEWNHGFRSEGLTAMDRAAFVASAIIYMQDSPIDLQAYYRADMDFGKDSEPNKTGRALVALGGFADTPVRLASSGGDTFGLAVDAARSEDGGIVRVIISNYEIAEDKRAPRSDTPDMLSVPGLFDLKLLPRRSVSYVNNQGYSLAMSGLERGSVYLLERFRLAESQDLEPVESREVRGPDVEIAAVLPPPAVELIVLRRR